MTENLKNFAKFFETKQTLIDYGIYGICERYGGREYVSCSSPVAGVKPSLSHPTSQRRGPLVFFPTPTKTPTRSLRSDRQGQSRAEDRNLERSRRRPHDEEEAAARERPRVPALVAAATVRGRCRRRSAAMRLPPSSASLAPPPRSSSHVRGPHLLVLPCYTFRRIVCSRI